MKLTFGDCSFDGAARELRRGDQPVPLTPKAFALLALLVERRPGRSRRPSMGDLSRAGRQRPRPR